MPDPPSPIPQHEPGRLAWLSHIRVGPGVVGKTSYVAIFGLLVLAVVGFRVASDAALLAIAAAAIVVVFGHQFPILKWAERNPKLALTEGQEVVRLEELTAAKGLPALPPSPPVPDPQHPVIIDAEPVRE